MEVLSLTLPSVARCPPLAWACLFDSTLFNIVNVDDAALGRRKSDPDWDARLCEDCVTDSLLKLKIKPGCGVLNFEASSVVSILLKFILNFL